MKWKVTQGGAYLFFPGTLHEYDLSSIKNDEQGWVVSTDSWKRTVVRHEYSDEFGKSATVLDFIYETNLQVGNEEWFVRFTSNIQNGGVFHTDLNGFNFDTHHFREDMPIQSQVFPMPTLASIEDQQMRMTILSEHAQGTASLEPGAIDVWLDRRLLRDDNLGLGQGVVDNVPTRTRFRVILEHEGYDVNKKEFDITPLCRRMWEELNHPLEAFGKLSYKSAQAALSDMGDYGMVGLGGTPGDHEGLEVNAVLDAQNQRKVEPAIPFAQSVGKQMTFLDSTPIVPVVIMVFKRVDYLMQCINSIRQSDMDQKRVPIIISQDGDVPEMTDYVNKLKEEFIVYRIVHSSSCYEHPDDFPGDSKGKLNQGFKGDSYGNPREGRVTCCKHHFTWMLKTVFEDLKFDHPVNNFLFIEEDYILGFNFYETIVRGLEFWSIAKTGSKDESLFGISLDPTDGNSRGARSYKEPGMYMLPFVSNPIVLGREMYAEFKKHAKEYCEFDDYNWDWSIVHLQAKSLLPRIVLAPTHPQAKHIGVEGGMHKMKEKQVKRMEMTQFQPDFHPTKLHPVVWSFPRRKQRKGFGGWSHPADINHCKQVLGVS
jgi:hypothetical protein